MPSPTLISATSLIAMNFGSILERLFKTFGQELEYSVREGTLVITLVPKSTIRPRPLVLQYNKERNVVLLINAITFEKFSKPKQFARIIRNLLEINLREISFRLIEDRKSINLEFQIAAEEVEGSIEKIIYAYAKVFSELMLISPQYTFYEYSRYGAQIGTRRIIVIAKKYDEIISCLPYESIFMIYPFLTIPDENGKYFVSTIGIDYIYFPILSIASEEKNMFKIYEPVSKPPKGVELIPKDVREYISEMLSYLREIPTSQRKLLEILDEIAKKPYIILERISELERLADELRREAPPPLPIYRTRQLTSFIERKASEETPLDEIVKKLQDFVRIIDLVRSMDMHIKEVSTYRMLVDLIRDTNFIISGKIHSEKVRKLQKFGAGNALYLSAEEVREFFSGSNYVKITFIEGKDGKKKIVVEPVTE